MPIENVYISSGVTPPSRNARQAKSQNPISNKQTRNVTLHIINISEINYENQNKWVPRHAHHTCLDSLFHSAQWLRLIQRWLYKIFGLIFDRVHENFLKTKRIFIVYLFCLSAILESLHCRKNYVEKLQSNVQGFLFSGP